MTLHMNSWCVRGRAAFLNRLHYLARTLRWVLRIYSHAMRLVVNGIWYRCCCTDSLAQIPHGRISRDSTPTPQTPTPFYGITVT